MDSIYSEGPIPCIKDLAIGFTIGAGPGQRSIDICLNTTKMKTSSSMYFGGKLINPPSSEATDN